MAIKMNNGKMDTVENVRLISVHDRKAQLSIDGRTAHVREDGRECLSNCFGVSYTMYTTRTGERYGFTLDEVCRAIMR